MQPDWVQLISQIIEDVPFLFVKLGGWGTHITSVPIPVAAVSCSQSSRPVLTALHFQQKRSTLVPAELWKDKHVVLVFSRGTQKQSSQSTHSVPTLLSTYVSDDFAG